MTYDITGAGQYAIAPNGTLAWLSGPVVQYPPRRLVTVDRHGQVAALAAAPALSYRSALRLSPDHHRLAVVVQTLTESRLWTYDLTRAAPLLPLTTEGEAQFPVWRPDGWAVFFEWIRGGQHALGMQSGDGAPVPLVSPNVTPSAVALDGRVLGMVARTAGLSYQIVGLTLDHTAVRVEPLFESASNDMSAAISPDGRWLLHMSNLTGKNEVYVRPYPGPGTPIPVSIEGGECPAWHPNGREIFFVGLPDADGMRRMMACPFTPASSPPVGPPTALFPFNPAGLAMVGTPARPYDVGADGQQFYAVQADNPAARPPVTHIDLIQNWFEELKAKAPVKR
jgi:hypothetical protein